MTPSYGAYPIETDQNGMPIPPTIVLSTKGGKKLGAINNIGEKIVSKFNLNSADEMSFDVYKSIGGVDCALWDSITDFKLIYVPQYRAWYEITANVDEDEEGNVVRSVSATHLEESELSQLLLYDIQINTEDDIDRDDYVPTVFYNEDNPKASLLNRLLADKASHYEIYHVDESLKSIQRTFEFNDTSIYDALMSVAEEIGCLFLFGEAQTNDGELTRSISAYELQTVCLNCGHRGDTVMDDGVGKCAECGSTNLDHGYGDDTHVFVSSENLADRLTYSGDPDSVKTCFRLEAGDDLMTATVINCNPNGSPYIWYIPQYLRDDMSTTLATALDDYDAEYEDYQTTHEMDVPSSAITKYNDLITKYKVYKPELEDKTITYPIQGYTNLMGAYYDGLDLYALLETTLMHGSPEVTDTTAAEQAALLTNSVLSPVAVSSLSALSLATANSTIVNYAKIFIDTSRYKLDVVDGAALNNAHTQWTGKLNVTSYTDEEDTADTTNLTIAINEDLETFVQQKMDKALASIEEKDLSLSTLLFMPVSTTQEVNAFRAELNWYSLSYLDIINSACNACLDVMIDNGCGKKSNDITSMYATMYQPMVKRSKQILAEIKERTSELKQLRSDGTSGKAILDYIEAARTNTRKALNMQTYLNEIDPTLWQELAAYRRDDTYSNSNYKSEDMTNAEIIDNAQKFLQVATHEIIKSATQQHSVTSTLQDLLVLPEFAPVVEHFELGNFIRVLIDETVYRLRLASYQFDYSHVESLNVTFTDVQAGEGFVSDVQSVLAQAQSMATSYDYVARQALNGSEARDQLQGWTQRGLDLTNITIVNNADNQDVVIDEQGIQLRRYYEDLDDFEDEQVKIINNGLYYTTDAWESVSAGIGHFEYYDPTDDFAVKDGYGVIADTIVGNIILGESIGIYNTSATFTANQNGVVIQSQTNPNDPNSDDSPIFQILKKNGSSMLTMTNDGNLNIVVNEFSLSSWTEGESIATNVDIDDAVDEVNTTIYATYAECSTAAGTVAKAATLSGFVLNTGARVTVHFTNSNSVANPTLNVNSTGAKPIYCRSGSGSTSTVSNITQPQWWAANAIITFVYDGSHWCMEIENQSEILRRLTNTTGTGATTGTKGIYLDSNNVLRINADYISTGTMSADYIYGGTLTLGGSNDVSGTFALKNASGTNVVTMNNTGITATAGKIGNFTIGSSSISNGMTSRDDTTNNGVWIGTNGIALGAGNFKVTSAGALTATSGRIANFVINPTYLAGYNSMSSGVADTQYQIYISSPDAVSSTSTGFCVRRRAYDGSVYDSWYNNFRVRYDGLVEITSPKESGKCINGTSLVNGQVARRVTINNGRLIVNRNETISGTESTYWTGFLDSGTYSASSTNHTRFMALTTYKTNIIGFATIDTSTVSTPETSSGFAFFYYGLEKTTFADSSKADGVMVCNRELRMQTCNIKNANNITCVSLTQTSDARLKNSIMPIGDEVLRRVSSVDIKQFKLNVEKDGTIHYGVIAQDVQKVMGDIPNSIVSSSPDKDGNEYLEVNYTEFLLARIAADEKRIAELESKLDYVMNKLCNERNI